MKVKVLQIWGIVRGHC